MLRVGFGLGRGFADEGPEDADEKCGECGQQHDHAALGFGLVIGLDGLVHHLDDGGILGLVDFGELELLGEQLVDGLVVLHFAQ